MIDRADHNRDSPLFADFPVFLDVEEWKKVEESTEGAWIARTPVDGTKWICKKAIRSSTETIHAEVACHMLAKQIGVAVPEGAIYRGSDCNGWLSQFLPEATPWSEDDLERLADPVALVRIIAFDAVMLVPDRHDENLLCTMNRAGRYDVTAIDFGKSKAVLGDIDAFAGRPFPISPHHIRGFPVRRFADEFNRTSDAISALPDEVVLGILRRSAEAAGANFSGTIGAALLRRSDAAHVIVNQHVHAIGELT